MLRTSVVFVFAALLGGSGCAGTEQDEGSSPLSGSPDERGEPRDRDEDGGDGGEDGEDGGDGEEPGDHGCADILFATFDQCLLDAGVDVEDESEEAQEIIAACWIDVANGAFDECCAATPDASCDTGGGDGDDGDGGDGGPDGSCAGVLFATNDACLAEAGSVDGDLDGSGEIDTEEELELVSYCWIEVGNGAFDECCAASPDETCDAGCGEGEHEEPAEEPVTGA